MKHWTWQNFKSAVIDKLNHTKPNTHFAAHLTSLDEEGKLTWFGILSHHRLFGKKCNFVLVNNMDFDDFADAVHMNPANQCTIKILMQDPRVEAKWCELEKAETKNLALTYGTGEEREKLEREKTCLAHNPKANVTGLVRNEKVQEITDHVLSKYSCTAKTMRIHLDNPPDDPEEFLSDAKDTFPSAGISSHSKADNTSPPKSDRSPSPDESLDTEQGQRQSSGSRTDIPSGESSSNIEVPKPNLDVHRSLARKVARSPAGREVNRDFRRLDFANPSRQPLLSPTRKIPSSQVSSSFAAEARPKAPLTKDGREMTWDDFLTRCSFAKDDIIVRALLSLNYIPHWDYFRTTSPSVLISELTGMRYPFPHAIAQRLVEGAHVLEFTHVQHGYSYSYEV
ncbi:hypothetical protein PCASD_08408 [Puccinia coronata f. sp. avenae]|uniref:Uncharacterized protein n=1 Tax=Puccinia coronata f. sp. avenae TaxID=200324 RepID=A0A2N5TG79_9BASI|nr:hypothetical protein PCASD_08408 [Puccinia coronata f. sp. avenae]